MTGQTLNRSSAGIMVLIIPIAFGIVILYKLWPALLGLTVLIISWKTWQNYQWQKWCQQVNPYFNNLVTENRGYLTPLDLSLKANLSPQAAKAFLERKSEEYGVKPQEIPDKGVVYYFPTASALGRIFDDSEPLGDLETEDTSASNTAELATTASVPKDSSTPSFKEITQLAKQTQEATSSVVESQKTKIKNMNQAELAKRLDVNSSTVGRNKIKPESDFAMWSQSKDPEGIAWKYLEATNEFAPAEAD
ncbi:MAG: hypothetical protein QNJ70_11315 [Xenococcaceae cyanobacterium MO_207.B15]|nr:hypothetical protein [Xenococcaceae cyanobacterium MO_207.B15]